MSTKNEPVDRKQAGEMRQSEREAFRTLATEVSMSESLKGERETIEALEMWVDAFGRDRVTAGIEWERERAEPEPTASIEDEAQSYVIDAEQKEQFAKLLSEAINLAQGGYTPHAQTDGLKMRHEVDAAILAKRAFKAGYRRGVNAVYDDAESGIDRKGFFVFCPECRYLNRYPGGFAPGGCGNCDKDLSNQPRYREVNRVEDVPVLEPIEEAREATAATAAHHDLRCPVCGSLEVGVLDDGETVCVACGNQWLPEPEPIARASHHDAGIVSATEYTNALNKAYSDGYKTGTMHGHGAGLREARLEYAAFWRSPFAPTAELDPVEEPAAETPLVHVTVSKKGRITASGPAPDVLAVLRGVLELEDEGSSLWGMPVVKTDDVPEGVIVVKQSGTPLSQAIREELRKRSEELFGKAESDTTTQQE